MFPVINRCLLLVLVLLPAGRGGSRVLLDPPLAVDDWHAGHELPDVVDGSIFGATIFVRVRVPPGRRRHRVRPALRNVRLEVDGSDYVLGAASPVGRDLMPGQRTSVHAPLRQVEGTTIPAAACPLRVSLRVMATRRGNGTSESVVAATTTVSLLCRTLTDRFSFVYLDFDGSPQLAAAKFPTRPNDDDHDNDPHPRSGGAAVLLSTHGMDVTAQRQADCYRPKSNLWVLAPHGRGTHGFNWQGPGLWSARYAMDALRARTVAWARRRPADRARVEIAFPYETIFTGHSNGGYGAWLGAALAPDQALACAPLAGMARMGTTEWGDHKRHADPRVWSMIDGSVDAYRGDLHAVAGNLRHLPLLARTGLQDRVISPRSTAAMGELLKRDAGVVFDERRSDPPLEGIVWEGRRPAAVDTAVQRQVVCLEGQAHWWWDTAETNDGGAMDDQQLRAFWRHAMGRRMRSKRPSPDGSDTPSTFTCVSPVLCGTHRGVRILWPAVPGKAAAVTVSLVRQEGTDVLTVATENVKRLRVEAAGGGSGSNGMVVVLDGHQFSSTVHGMVFCRNMTRHDDGAATASWSSQCGGGRMHSGRSANLARFGGPARRIFAAPFAIVVGTAGGTKAAQRYARVALELANAWAAVGGGVASVVLDTEWPAVDARRRAATARNLILLGGPHRNGVTRSLAGEQPWRFTDDDGADTGGVAIGPCRWTETGIGWVSLGPGWHQHQDEGADADGHRVRPAGMVVTLAGTSPSGFAKAVELFRSQLFVANRWQHRLPEWVVAGPGYRVASGGVASLRGVVAAGWWGDAWEFVPAASAGTEACRGGTGGGGG